MFFWNKFCGKIASVIFLVSIASAGFCQQFAGFPNGNNIFLKNNSGFYSASFSQLNIVSKKNTIFFDASHAGFLDPNKTKNPEVNDETSSQPVLPADFSICNYAFFCRQELKLEKISHVPIRIRLGSLAQCNYYEGKR
ncbi:MAG: hypothetical protein ABI359_04350 [Ginsengibacter sp.]